MPTSVMPKGVEHSDSAGGGAAGSVMPTSVMPKGVEHNGEITVSAAKSEMPTSVMPKGVEHILIAETAGRDPHAHLCDAERR